MQAYRQPEILVAEGNIDAGTLSASEPAQAQYITQAANEAYYRGPSKLKGYVVYELLDQVGATPSQAHYGLVRYVPGSPGVIGPEKQAYGAYRAVIERKR
jgi:hypothetical protein